MTNAQWAAIPAFMPSVTIAISAIELTTAALLLGQFYYSRYVALAWLAAAYLFSGAIVIPFILTFPEAFSPDGLLGAGPQTTSWLWMFWHLGFPALVLGYVGCVHPGMVDRQARSSRAAKIIGAIVAAVLALTILLTALTTAWHDVLPVVYENGRYFGITSSGIGPASAILCLLSIYGLWHFTRLRSVLNLWLAVAMAAFFLDICGVLGGGTRYSSSWYMARISGLVSATTILIVFLVELNSLYARLTIANAKIAADNERLRVAEAELAARTETLRTAFENMSDGVCAFDSELRLLAWNGRFLALRQYPESLASVGATYRDFLTFDLGRQSLPESERVRYVEREMSRVREATPRRFERDGPGGMVLEVRENPVPSGGFVRSYSDITERKRAEAGLIASKKQTESLLVQAQKMEALGHLTGGLAHDFNNLLGVIIGNLDLLAEDIERDDHKHLTETALQAALRGAELTHQLLAFARRQTLQPRIVDVNELAAAMIKLLGRLLGDQVTIRLQLSPSGVWPVRADPSQLESAIVNISTNARDAMPGGGTLTVRTINTVLDRTYAEEHTEVVAGDYVLLEISDTGSGMPPETLEKVFEPFFTTKEVGKGTGLGLSMVFGFVKQSGGHIKIYSEVGHGTVMRIYLPRAQEDEIQHAENNGAVDNGLAGSETILAVDDNPQMRHVVSKQLRSLGYAVIEATNGPEALNLVRQNPGIDLLFTDLVMPGGLSGQELAKRARETAPRLKVLFTSGFPQGVAHGFELKGEETLLTKPYRKLELARRVREALDA